MEITPLLTRVARSTILSGDVLRDSVLVPLVADGSLAAAISPGKRAFSIRVTEEGGVAGFVLPGNYVDILYVSKDNSGKALSDLLLSNILVLAIAQERNQANRSEPKVVNVITLEVSPDQAEKINQANASGTLSLNLRNQLDKTDLVGSNSSQNEPAPTIKTKGSARGSNPSIEVIRGTARNME
jgi:pilus assembly protein CpaB